MINRKEKAKKYYSDLRIFEDKTFETKVKLIKHLPYCFIEEFKTDLFGNWIITFNTKLEKKNKNYQLEFLIQSENLSYNSTITIPIRISDFYKCNIDVDKKILRFKDNIYQKEEKLDKYVLEMIRYMLVRCELIYDGV